MEELWAKTQDPEQHQRWDMRFSRIVYQPRPDPELPQTFVYERAIVPGLTIAGQGETTGERSKPDGTRASALSFSSDDPRSLIEEGSGYWRYVPDGDNIRFLTRYDYRPRWGRFGRVIDRLLFRPLLGWATAWSFDRLRLWIEEGRHPEAPLHRSRPSARRCLRAQRPAPRLEERSIYAQAMGSAFEHLHPRVQRRFGFSSADRVAHVGTGVMEEIWRGSAFTLPFLALGSWRRIMFPHRGRDVPFTISNYAYLDPYGRETVTWSRRFEIRGRPRPFDATMVYSDERSLIVDYLGTHQHLAVDLHLDVDERGGLRLRSGDQRFYEGPVSFRFPLLLSGVAQVNEWWDESEERFRIEVAVVNRLLGPLFGYRGWFTVQETAMEKDEIPADVLPRRDEWRE